MPVISNQSLESFHRSAPQMRLQEWREHKAAPDKVLRAVPAAAHGGWLHRQRLCRGATGRAEAGNVRLRRQAEWQCQLLQHPGVLLPVCHRVIIFEAVDVLLNALAYPQIVHVEGAIEVSTRGTLPPRDDCCLNPSFYIQNPASGFYSSFLSECRQASLCSRRRTGRSFPPAAAPASQLLTQQMLTWRLALLSGANGACHLHSPKRSAGARPITCNLPFCSQGTCQPTLQQLTGS